MLIYQASKAESKAVNKVPIHKDRKIGWETKLMQRIWWKEYGEKTIE